MVAGGQERERANGWWKEGASATNKNGLLAPALLQIISQTNIDCCILKVCNDENLWQYTMQNTKISLNFMMWKFSGKDISPKLYGNWVFSQNFHTMKLGEILVFSTVIVSAAFRICNATKIPNKHYIFFSLYARTCDKNKLSQ